MGIIGGEIVRFTRPSEATVSDHDVHKGRDQLRHEFFVDENDNPAGGSSFAEGIDICWQNGVQQPNGAIIDDLLGICVDRLRFYNGDLPGMTPAQAKFRNRYNSLAITAIEEALGWLQRRTLARRLAGTEGTYKP